MLLDTKITLVDSMGSDLSIVNAARVSFGGSKKKVDEKDVKLIQYLAKHKHMSPFRHVQMTFKIEALPEAIARQLYKHQVGCGYTGGEFREAATVWNEISGRYVKLDTGYYTPSMFRQQSADNKQASTNTAVPNDELARALYDSCVAQCNDTYEKLLALGVCREQARLVLPLSMNTSFVWTLSLEALAHFIKLRQHPGAQAEIQEVASRLAEEAKAIAPLSLAALLNTLNH